MDCGGGPWQVATAGGSAPALRFSFAAGAAMMQWTALSEHAKRVRYTMPALIKKGRGADEK
jgi:hypothetical protein